MRLLEDDASKRVGGGGAGKYHAPRKLRPLRVSLRLCLGTAATRVRVCCCRLVFERDVATTPHMHLT